MISRISVAILAIIFGYIFVCVFIGWLAHRRSGRGVRDFYVASGTLGPFIMAGTVAATGYSAYAVLGGPGWFYSAGLAPAFFEMAYVSGSTIGIIFVGSRIYKAGVYHKFITPADLIAKRFNDRWVTRIVVGLFITILFSIFYISAQLIGCTYVITGLSGGELPYIPILLIMALAVMVYIIMGGMRAVAYTDFLQFIMMIILVGGLFVLTCRDFGGLHQIWDTAIKIHPSLTETGYPRIYWVTAAMSCMLASLAFPHVWNRCYANRGLNGIGAMAIGNVFIAAFVIILGYTTMGAAISAEFPNPATAPGPGDQLTVFYTLGLLGPVLGALMFTGAMAAAFSTADSILLTVASSFSQDILGLFGWPKTERNQLLAARILIAVLLGTAILGGLHPTMPLIKMVTTLTYPGYMLLVPIALIGIFWRRANRYGILSALVGGMIVCLLITVKVIPTYGTYEGFFGVILAAVLLVVVSLLTPAPSKQQIEEFYGKEHVEHA